MNYPCLFSPLQIGPYQLRHRVVMAPLTRMRAEKPSLSPRPLNAEYYGQRATPGGLIIAEATPVMVTGHGNPGVPGIYSERQIAGWRAVVDAVHAKGGLIFLQLWHVGRVSHSSFQPGGALPVAPSAVPIGGGLVAMTAAGPPVPYQTPRALETAEIAGVVESFRQGARNAQEAGFDGVEIHGANGYLLDQFLQDKTNRRSDGYGGPIEHRARLMLEVTDACIAVWGAGRVGMHLSPRRDSHDMGDSDPAATFGYVARELGRRKIAFICAREAVGDDSLGPLLKQAFGGVYIANEKLDKESAQRLLDAGSADAVAFGKAFIANPDLPRRLLIDAPLNAWDSTTFYGTAELGYINYPALKG